MKNVLKIIKFIGLLLWQLPQSIIGWIMILYFNIVDNVKFIKYHNGAFIFTSEMMSGSISLGTVIILCTVHSKSDPTIQHELGHVKQSHYLGLLYLFIIGLPSICWAGIYKLFTENYYIFYTEKWANKLGKVETYKYHTTYKLKIIENILWE